MTGCAQTIDALLGETPVTAEQLAGGDLSDIVRLRFASGSGAVAKRGGTARAEAAMLEAIRASGAPAPRVLAVTDDLLLLEDLGPDNRLADAWPDLADTLHRLHSATGAGYGWPDDHRFGPVAIPNAPLPSWPAFWAERRLLPCCQAVPAPLARRIERLCGRLDTILPRDPRPALLHGDLWTGNVMVRGARVTGLIDPACYYGHFEVDLGMLCLFGTPPAAFWARYGTPAPRLRTRRPVYQLWPALVHLRLFGPGYLGLVDRLLGEAGA